MKRKYRNFIAAYAVFAGASLLVSSYAHADEHDARNFITVATGSVPSAGDSRIKSVERQLDAIQAYCGATSSGAGIHDKIAKAHSLLRTQQSLLELLSDFVRVASAQCDKIDSGTLISLYVLERNAGETHIGTVMRLAKNPRSLVAK